MLKIPWKVASYLLDTLGFDKLGYVYEEGGGGGVEEFTIWVKENGDTYLVHRCEIKEKGFWIKLKNIMKNELGF